MEIDSQELQLYLESSLEAILKGVEGKGNFRISDSIEFDLAVTNTQEGGGGLKIYIVDAKANFKSEQISHIKLKASPRRPAQVFQPRLAQHDGQDSNK